ncbi:gfo/Idh/MocA family oxidoreductase [Oceanobacillus arenosus]|uniref:Gfo/Idh/MocA family oxidoreductase n=1 Tax=Oceanobacillus arenosus TaxID=1229153 RepID=A0A3D8PPE4_9BACI|nr:Gfo/Idh/MocA family oxidoreductase [Oceanobacillus arenosus]RDW17118.1 gfo/Idh/MocA family oxidoreductase [Oceanobacillus arenosus]
MKFSTIGTSWITEAFINATTHFKEVELASVYSRTEEMARSFATKHGAKEWFTNIEEMLQTEIDFVYIASPNSMHYEHILTCIDHHKHVFCEKPLVLNEQQWQVIHERAKQSDIYVFEGYRHLFSPNYKLLKKSLLEVGQVRSVMFQYIQYSSKYDAFKNGNIANVFMKEFAGGALMDLGVYPLSMAIDLFGEPNDTTYFPVLLENGIDGSGTLVLTYDAFNVTILCSKIAQANMPSEIQGEDGTITVDHIAPIRQLAVYNRKTKENVNVAEEQLDLDMVYEVEVFLEMMNEGNIADHERWLERSRQVAKSLEIARKKQGSLLFPGE